jgi:hypothetical protein
MNDLLEWIEKAALENLRGHTQSADVLAKEAGTTLTILLATLSGAFAYALKTEDYRVGAVALTAYIFALCVALVINCMMIGEFPAITNEPRNLNQEGYELDVLCRVELRNIQERIDRAAQRNALTAQWLNRVRIGAICSPLIFAATIFAEGLVHHGAQVVAAG